jgi:DNA modification methylase
MKIHCKYDELVPLKKLKPYDRNRNKHPQEQIERLAKLLDYQGQRAPIIVGTIPDLVSGEPTDPRICKGHGTAEAIELLGEKSVAVVYQAFEDEDQRYAFVQSDNAIASWAELDLAGINQDIGELGPDFDIDLLGIQGFEVDVADKYDDADADAVPEPPKEAKTKRGELWLLGKHRLLCGDSTALTDVERLMGGGMADTVFTDPPYNIGFVPQRGTHGAIQNDDMSPERFKEFLSEAVGCAYAVSKPDTFAFIWSGWSTIDQFAPVLRNFYTVKAMPVWVKNNFGIGYYSRPKYEPFFLCLKGEPEKPEPAPADVWEHSKVVDTCHSCEKPVGLIELILNAYSNRGPVVLDLFGGSGSTLVACQKTGREARVMEIDPLYCDVILTRFAKFSGVDPIREDGTPWSQVKGEG